MMLLHSYKRRSDSQNDSQSDSQNDSQSDSQNDSQNDSQKDSQNDSCYANRKVQDGILTQSGISHYGGLVLDAIGHHWLYWVSTDGTLWSHRSDPPDLTSSVCPSHASSWRTGLRRARA